MTNKFSPSYTNGTTVAPNIPSVAVEIPDGQNANAVCLTNLGATNTAYVRIGGSDVIASAADFPILPASQVIIRKSPDHLYIAHYAGAAASLHIMAGKIS